MPHTSGFNHVATLTSDLDGYLAFYVEMFDAEVVAVSEAQGNHPRMAVVDMGGHAALNVFEVREGSIVGDRTRMTARGPIDHYALSVDSEEQLLSIRDRLVAAGASPGDVTEFGPEILSVFFRDPDGAELEVVYRRPITAVT